MDKYPFTHIFQCLAYYVFKNPARQKAINLLEPEVVRRPIAEMFSGEHPQDLWSSILLGIERRLKDYDPKVQKAFKMYHFDEKRRYSKQDCAELVGLPSRLISRRFKEILEDLDEEFKARELIEPEGDNENRKP